MSTTTQPVTLGATSKLPIEELVKAVSGLPLGELGTTGKNVTSFKDQALELAIEALCESPDDQEFHTQADVMSAAIGRDISTVLNDPEMIGFLTHHT